MSIQPVFSKLRVPAFLTSSALAFQLFNPNLSTAGIVVSVALLVISLGIHEATHALVALWCGDPTARDLGRITLNPIPHIDPWMTIIIPFVMFTWAGFLFGGAKPVPVNMARLRSPMRDMSLVAIAGPLSNFLLAIFFGVIYVLLIRHRIYSPEQMMVHIMGTAVYANILLAAFNLMPIPPLDGSRVMAWLLPKELRKPYVELERFGILLVFGLFIFVPQSQVILMRAMSSIEGVVMAIANPVSRVFDPLVKLFL